MNAKSFRLISKSKLAAIFQKYRPGLDPDAYLAAAQVFPTRLNNHVVEDLIDWSQAPSDPLFRLSIPQPEMLRSDDLGTILAEMQRADSSRLRIRAAAEAVRRRMNPHPAGQKSENVPYMDGRPCQGIQHKYRETVLFFPTEGQFCHAYCTYCFRWAQFTAVGSDQTFRNSEPTSLARYIKSHVSVTDVLFTGGDPLVMPASTLRRYMEPLFGPSHPPHLDTIRIGTKALAWWPYRFSTDSDSKELLQLFSDVVASGKHLTLQAHCTHPREIEHPAAQKAIRLIRMTGAQIRSQAPLIRHINDDPDLWTRMWKLQTRLGIVPYYMFVERDTGARDHFSVPLAQAFSIFSTAFLSLPGTARTVRGPSMSASPGKVCIVGIADIQGDKYFALKFLQSRNPQWSQQIFFAMYDPAAVWLDDLKPAFGQAEFFFERQYESQKRNCVKASSGQLAESHWL